MGNKADDFISQMMEETFGVDAKKPQTSATINQLSISRDRKFLFFTKNETNIMIPSNWSVFNELMLNANQKNFFYIFITKHNDESKLREIILNDVKKNLLFYTIQGEIHFEEIVGANIFPIINKVLSKAA